jgi:hypothetical protein
MIGSSGKCNGQNSNDKNDCSGPYDNSNAVQDQRYNRVVFVKAKDHFHRFCFDNSKLACLFQCKKQNGKNHFKSPSSTWESCETSAAI